MVVFGKLLSWRKEDPKHAINAKKLNDNVWTKRRNENNPNHFTYTDLKLVLDSKTQSEKVFAEKSCPDLDNDISEGITLIIRKIKRLGILNYPDYKCAFWIIKPKIDPRYLFIEFQNIMYTYVKDRGRWNQQEWIDKIDELVDLIYAWDKVNGTPGVIPVISLIKLLKCKRFTSKEVYAMTNKIRGANPNNVKVFIFGNELKLFREKIALEDEKNKGKRRGDNKDWVKKKLVWGVDIWVSKKR